MTWGKVAAATVAAFLVVMASTPIVERWARARGLLDWPGGRHLHARAVPRLGGVALFLGFGAGSLAWVLLGGPPDGVGAVLAGALVVWAVGLWDDVRGLQPGAKLLGQVLASAVAVLLGLHIEFLSVPRLGGIWEGRILHLGTWSYPLTILWLTAVSNAVNLLDGLDGLAAGVVAIAALPTAVAAWAQGFYAAAALLSVLGAGCLAFLRYNFSPARIFMGDSGALMLGFAFAGAAALGTAKGPAAMTLLVPVLSLGVPLLDTAWAILRRLLAGRPVGAADNGHVHYLLLAGGRRPAWRVVLMLYGASAALGALAVVLSPQSRSDVMLGVGLAAAALILSLTAGWHGRPSGVAREAEGEGARTGDAHLRHPPGGYQAGSGYPHPGGLRRL